MNKWNGCCPESGWDKFEQQVREEFIEYAIRVGMEVSTNSLCPWQFENNVTEIVWRGYHQGHVSGRMFDCGE